MGKGVNTQVLQKWWGGGSSTFLGLSDTPDLYTGQTLKWIRVNAGETALEFFTLGWGWSFSLTEAEIDFGSWVPVRSKRFAITNASITGTSKIMVSPSWNVATGRVGNDWEWDTINFSAKAGTWSFELTATSSWRIRGNRKIFYSFS